MAELRCLPLSHLTDGPVIPWANGQLTQLQNMSIREGGYAESRGGFEAMKPSGGTTVALTSAAFSSVCQVNSSYGWVRTFDTGSGVYSANLQLHKGGYLAFPAGAVGDALYWGSDQPFSRIGISLSVAATWGATTIVYEYWNGASWTALTTAESVNWTIALTLQFASWTLPSNWATSTQGSIANGNVLKYWIRIRISAGGGVGGPKVMTTVGFWAGARDTYFATNNPLTSATSGTLARWGQNGTAAEGFNISTSLYSGSGNNARMVSYRGRLVLVNGKETKVWDGASLEDLGIPQVTDAVTAVNFTPGAGTTMGAGVWRYYLAWGRGPCQNFSAYADRSDALALYGPGQAVAVSNGAGGFDVTTGAADNVRVDLHSVTPSSVSAVYLYRTQDLTNVVPSDRPNFPAFLIQSFRIQDLLDFETPPGAAGPFGGIGNYYVDSSRGYAFPQQEAITYDCSPPPRCKYATVYQNRLILADDFTTYWSDPFYIDRFSLKTTTGFLRFEKAEGGKNMGITEFADQIVLHSETQVWAITNVDLDVPQLFPVDLAEGCVASDAISAQGGWLIWPSRTGFKAWDGKPHGPKAIQGDLAITFRNMSHEVWGGSRGVLCDGDYDFVKCAPGGTPSAYYRYDTETGRWNTVALGGSLGGVMAPLGRIHLPLGNNDAAAMHTIWGKIDYAISGNRGPYVAELTTQDDGSNYICAATMVFAQPPGTTFAPKRVICYYQAADGWQNFNLSSSITNHIGSDPGSFNAGTPDTGDDYGVIGGVFLSQASHTADVRIQFTAQSLAGGTLNNQRLYGAVLEGEPGLFRRGTP